MRAATDLFLSERGEPALDLIQPRGRCGREVHMESRMTSKPALHRRRFVRAVIVHDQMDIEIGGHACVDRAQELEEFLAAVTPVQLTNDFSRSDVECSEKRRGAVSHIVVGPPLGDTGRQGQYRLSAIERLNLAL